MTLPHRPNAPPSGSDATDGPQPAALAGRCVLLTRPQGQGDGIAEAVLALGGRCLHMPVIRIGPPTSWEPLDGALRSPEPFAWTVFTSVNGVRGFVERLRGTMAAVRPWPHPTARIAAIGVATARALAEAGLRCDLVPERSDSEGMLEALLPALGEGEVLLVRAERGRDVLPRGLAAAGHRVTEVAAYATRPVERLEPDAARALSEAGVDWVTVTSGAVAEAAARLFGERFSGWRRASISPVTSRVLERLGYPADCEASRPEGRALVDAIAAWEGARRDAGGPPGPDRGASGCPT